MVRYHRNAAIENLFVFQVRTVFDVLDDGRAARFSFCPSELTFFKSLIESDTFCVSAHRTLTVTSTNSKSFLDWFVNTNKSTIPGNISTNAPVRQTFNCPFHHLSHFAQCHPMVQVLLLWQKWYDFLSSLRSWSSLHFSPTVTTDLGDTLRSCDNSAEVN